ncbi:NGFI-A-binding protein homolog isoform X2 [Penaeus japonicus]|uniref:NGFI-A-binding protein homolog isoform X2 n=1 Tax=Penaeus japonicus TaxID=27405 RepID=UPI001C716EEF|nr:NGFI-A-binding protein homolog isoform X2 [Penaeus japonicus]
MLLVPPISRAHSAEPLVPPPAESNRSPARTAHAAQAQSLAPIKAEPPHLLNYTSSPALADSYVRPHMSGLSDAQYPPASTATHSAPSTPAPPSTPTPAPPVTASSDRSASGGSASGGSLPLSHPQTVGGPPPAGGLPIVPPTTNPSSGVGVSVTSGAVTPAMPVPGPSQAPQSSQQQPPLHHPLLGYIPHGTKILSRNLNGTREYNRLNYPPISQSERRAEPQRRSQDFGPPMAVTSQPSNESELQLYRVLQRANLLNYYDTFISQGTVKGGDDVQQLCEAGEEEFLEIMALVGMASKPLHVRRLQKALQEWVSNPARMCHVRAKATREPSMFQIPLLPNLPPSVAAGFPSLTARALLGTPTPTPTRPSPPMTTPSIHANHNSSPGISKETIAAMNSNSLGAGGLRDSVAGVNPPGGVSVASTTAATPSIPSSVPGGCNTGVRDGPMGLGGAGMGGPMTGMAGGPMGGGPMGGGPIGGPMGGGMGGSRGPSPHHTSPTHPGIMPPSSVGLQNCHGTMTAEKNADFFLPLMKYIMNMSEDDPRRMEEIRKYAAIYGRFDCKRKPEKPLTLHEVSVNEAAAQICKYMPALLTRRDELFPLARQVVRDSGYQYSKGHSRLVSQTVVGREDEPRTKRSRSDSGHDTGDLKNDLQWKKRQERLEAISEELRHMSERAEEVRTSLTSGTGDVSALTSQMDALQTRHAQLTLEQNELLKAQRKAKSDRVSVCSEDRERGEDSDSQFSYSGASSPSQSYLQQLVQDTLVDEGLRVVKESLNQQKDAVSAVVSRAQDGSYPRPPQQQQNQQQNQQGQQQQTPQQQQQNQQGGLQTENNAVGGGAKQHNSTGGAQNATVSSASAATPGRLVSPPTTYADMFSYPESKVLSSSQGNIIAVANPALSMSAAMASSQMSDEERHISALYTLSQTVGAAAAAARGNSIKQEPNSPGATKQE